MTVYIKDLSLSNKNPLKFPHIVEAYELRLIDDVEDYYIPDYDMNCLDNNEEIGEFESLALVENK